MSSAEPSRHSRISCKRCQQRKLRCSRTIPCASCTKAGHECEYRQEDGRKIPVSKHYVTSLEQQIASLQEALRDAQSSGLADKNTAPLGILSVCEEPRTLEPDANATIEHREVRAGNVRLNTSSRTCTSYQGPTSIYRFGSVCDQRGATLTQQSTTPSLYCTINAEEPDVDEILRSFFRWQYPEYMFLYREALLLDYLNHEYQGRYCSLALIYSICALGCIPDKGDNHNRVTYFMKKSYANISTVKTLEVNSTTVQTFLCLAFGELAVGNISKAWLLSGMAFRSLQDIGLQYDGQAGRSKDGRSIPELDSEIRRRIYWGCYTADSMIALLLGRPVFFQDFDAAVSPSEQLPDNVTLMAWLPDETEDQQIPRLIPFFKGLGGLSKICHQLLLHVFTVQSSLSGSSTTTVAALQRFDLSLCRWHNNLDSTLRWNRWKSQAPSTSNHVFLLHLYYLSLRLCVLEELLGRSGDCDKQKLFHKTSDELIEDIAQLLRQIMSSSRIFRPPVIMIYATAVAIHSSQRLASRSELQSSQEHHHARSQVLLKTLRACGQAWAFARQVHDQLSSKALDISTTGEQVPNRSSQHQEVRLERSAETGGTTLHANTDPRPPDNLMEEGYSDLTGDPLDGSFNLPGFIFSLGTLTHPLEDCMF